MTLDVWVTDEEILSAVIQAVSSVKFSSGVAELD